MKQELLFAALVLSLAACKDSATSSSVAAPKSAPTASEPAAQSQIASAAPVNSGTQDFPLDEGVCVTTNPVDQDISDGNLKCVGHQEPEGPNLAPGPAPGSFNGSGNKGHDLFFAKQFGTNGRTCGTCHDPQTGTISPEQVRARYAANPDDPLFRAIDSDNGDGVSYDLLRNRATIRVHIRLAPNVCVLNESAPDPAGLIKLAQNGGIPPSLQSAAKALCSPATEVVLNRGVPSMFNTPALDPLLMSDGRETDVTTQAGDAVDAHFQRDQRPSHEDMAAIADFERTLFTSDALASLAKSGVQPELPMPAAYNSNGTRNDDYDSQLRGRDFFVSQKFDPNSPKKGLCSQCHGGPMLDTVQGFVRLTMAGSGVPKNGIGAINYPGDRFTNSAVSQLNGATTRDRVDADSPNRLTGSPSTPPGHFNTSVPYLIGMPDGTTILLQSVDPGRGLITGSADDWNNFRIPTLWGISKTAPYFHDNSAETLEDVVHHYAQFFAIIEFAQQNIVITPQDEADLVAFMKLL